MIMSNSDMNRRPSHRGSASVRRSRRRDASGGSANTGSSFQTKSSGGGSAARPSQKLSSGRDTSGSQSDGGNAKKSILGKYLTLGKAVRPRVLLKRMVSLRRERNSLPESYPYMERPLMRYVLRSWPSMTGTLRW